MTLFNFILNTQAYARININSQLRLFFIFAGDCLIFYLFQVISTKIKFFFHINDQRKNLLKIVSLFLYAKLSYFFLILS